MFHVLILNAVPTVQDEIYFEGQATSVILPGVDGELEILDFHKPIITKLKKGLITVDNTKEFPIRGGVVKMNQQNLVAMIEV